MTVEIIKSKKLGNNNFIDGQRYAFDGKSYAVPDDGTCVPILHYHLIVEGELASVLFPATCSVLSDEEVTLTSRLQRTHKEMTDDAVVKDGDYVTAIKERLNVDISDVGPDFDTRALRRL